MNKFIVSVLFCLLAPTLFASDHSFLIASYNLRFNNPNDSINAWPNRKEWVKHLVRFHEFDIFGTQEGLKGQLEDLDEMEEFAYIGSGRDNGIDAGEHSAIFYKPTRFALLDNGDFWFSETPDKPSFGWDATSHKRICSWAKLKDLQSDKTFFVFCAHYDHRGQIARAESSKLILSKVNQLAGNYPVVVLGDLNALPDSEPIAILNNQLKDAYLHTELPPYGPVGTANGFNWERDLTDRIDYIFTNDKVNVLKYGCLSDFKDKRYPSDHLPIVSKVVLLD